MKKIAFFLSVFLLSLSVFAQSRPKVALVLCGGGAKGAAHIGAIKVIEEAGIPVDMVVGTSMGAIVGGLYAVGYTPRQMDSIIRVQDWQMLLSDKTQRLEHSFLRKEYMDKYFISLPLQKKKNTLLSGGLIKGQNVQNLLTRLTIGYHDSINFDSLPIPFACVAEDVISGEEVVFHNGNLTTAIRASMSIPGVFVPVRLDGKLLVDGGTCNNFPVDVAREMGADIVIGVDIQNDLKKNAEELDGIFPVLSQIIDLSTAERYKKNVEDTDVHIKVNVEGYTAASFTSQAIDTLIVRGKIAALQRQSQLDSLRRLLNPENNSVQRATTMHERKIFYVKDVSFSGMDEHDEKVLMRRMRFHENDSVSIAQIDRMVSMMSVVLNYASVSYQLVRNASDDSYELKFFMKEKTEGNVNIGVRFDTEEIAAVQMNVTNQFQGKLPLRLSVTGRLGKRTAISPAVSISPSLFSDLNISYKFSYNDINLNQDGSRLYNFIYRYHLLDVNLSNMLFYYRLKFAVGVQYENFSISGFLYKKSEIYLPHNHAGFLSYYVRFFYDSCNKRTFPSKGSFVDLGYLFITQNGLKFSQLKPFSDVYAEWKTYIPLTRRFVIVPAVSARFLFGSSDIPFPYQNTVGGFVSGRYMKGQLPFAGVKAFEMAPDNVFIPSLTLRQRLWKKHYVSFTGNVLFADNDIFGLFKSLPDYGVSLAYGYDSFFGPLEAMFSYTNRGEKFSFYVNLGLNF